MLTAAVQELCMSLRPTILALSTLSFALGIFITLMVRDAPVGAGGKGCPLHCARFTPMDLDGAPLESRPETSCDRHNVESVERHRSDREFRS